MVVQFRSIRSQQNTQCYLLWFSLFPHPNTQHPSYNQTTYFKKVPLMVESRQNREQQEESADVEQIPVLAERDPASVEENCYRNINGPSYFCPPPLALGTGLDLSAGNSVGRIAREKRVYRNVAFGGLTGSNSHIPIIPFIRTYLV